MNPAPAPSPKTPKIQIVDLHKSFGSNYVLRGINFEIMAGEALGGMGGSGRGKTGFL